jgi:acyl carrier protein
MAVFRMSIRAAVISEIERIRGGSRARPPLTEDLVLLESGLDSLGVAILVTRLEDNLGLDPFTESEITSPPVTLGDFIRLYENAAQSS